MLKPFSEDISTGGEFQEIKLELGSPEWQKLSAKIREWKREGGILHAKLRGELQPIGLPIKAEAEERMKVSDNIQEARQTFLSKSPEEKTKEIEWLEWQANAELRYPEALSEKELNREWQRFLALWNSLSGKELEIITKDLAKLGLFDVTPYAEDISIDWQKLREEIKRWKKAGGILKAKLKGKKEEIQHKKRIEELIAERGPALTLEEQDEIAATPGIVPPWFPKAPGRDNYYYGAIKAIKELGVSALDVHLATERDYTDQSLNAKEKKILKVGWPEVKHSENIIPYGEYYHRDVGWY